VNTVKPVFTTTSDQQSPVNNGQFDSSTTSQNLHFMLEENGHMKERKLRIENKVKFEMD
jgi:hypothetical protein